MLNNTFLKPTLILLAVAIPAWFIVRGAFRRRTPGLDISFAREFLLFVFYLYIIGLMAVTLVPLSYSVHRTPGAQDINMVPFKNTMNTIRHNMSGNKSFSPSMLFQNTAGNIVLFLPFGLLLPLVARRMNSFLAIFFAGLVCSAAIEYFQYVERNFGIYRIVDIDDVILNTTGAVIGWMILRVLQWLASIKTSR